MTAPVPHIHETVVDGITTFWVETPPPLTAGLTFRIGAWDESPLDRGITHLAEHLALYELRKVEHPYNGLVGGHAMSIWASGTEAQLREFFGTFSGQIRNLPVGRLETETKVLKVEADQRQFTYHDHILQILFGPNGPGLQGALERGLDVLSPCEIQAWADRYCVRDNAVLTISGKPPETLGIDLPRGDFHPFALPGEALGYRPERLELAGTQEHGICVGALGRRSTDLVMALEVLGPRLTDRLRHELGLVYTVQPSYLPLDEDMAYVFAGTDATGERLEETASAFLGVIRGLLDAPPSEEEVARARRTGFNLEQIGEAAVARGELGRVAWDRLLRHPGASWAELMTEREEASPASIHEAFCQAVNRGIVWAPACDGLDLPERRKRTSEPVKGVRFKPKRVAPGSIERMLVGPDGLSCYSDARWVTLLWAELALAERTEPDEWSLQSRTGAWLTIGLGGWRRRRKLARLLEAKIPTAVRWPQPRRTS